MHRWIREGQEQPLRAIVNPVKHIARFPAVIVRVKDNGHNTAFAQLPPKEDRKAEEWVHLVPKLKELTLSAHTITQDHLSSFNLFLPDWFDYDQESVSEEDQLGANFAAFSELTHLHLYFANLDDMNSKLLKMLLNLPKLTHLRLSRPYSYYESRYDLEGDTEDLADMSMAIPRLLSKRRNCVRMQSIIIQAGTNFDSRVMKKLEQLQRKEKRLQLIYKKLAKPKTKVSNNRYYNFMPPEMRGLMMKVDSIKRGEGYYDSEDEEGFADSGDDGEEEEGELEYDSDVPLMKVAAIKGKPKETKKDEASLIANTPNATDKKCEKLSFNQFAERASGGQGVWSKSTTTLWY